MIRLKRFDDPDYIGGSPSYLLFESLFDILVESNVRV